MIIVHLPERKTIYHLCIGLLIIIALFVVYVLLANTEILSLLDQREAFLNWTVQLGVLGPLAIIGLMTIAIVISPLPSAPIALVAGAAYGHGWGTLYVLVGAELGAVIAFVLARLLGHSVMRHWLGEKLDQGWIGSQNTIMLVVFVSRLMPFLSFDLISYAAGLTSLKPWRFAVATLLGILPASFILAHFGAELGSGAIDRIVLTVVILGLLAVVPLLLGNYWKDYVSKHSKKNQ